MKILHVSFSDIDGGASVSAYRLCLAQRAAGLDACMFVAKKLTDHDWVYEHPRLKFRAIRYLKNQAEKLWVKIKTSRLTPQFSFAQISSGLRVFVDDIKPDIINLHWTNGGLSSPRDLAELKGYPVVWTLHDMWSFTGGCHYSYDCKGYVKSCGECPQLVGNDTITAKHITEKKTCFEDLNLYVVAPSTWLTRSASESNVLGGFPSLTIPYGIDHRVFKPERRDAGRKALRLNSNDLVVLFGAVGGVSDSRKGFDLLIEILNASINTLESQAVKLIVFGQDSELNLPNSLGNLNVIQTGHISDPNLLAEIYAAADVFLCPSRADNLPNTVIESLSCGTPCVAFSVGGLSDQVVPGISGYLAEAYDTSKMAQNLEKILLSTEKEKSLLRRSSRIFALENYSPQLNCQRYKELYQSILSTK